MYLLKRAQTVQPSLQPAMPPIVNRLTTLLHISVLLVSISLAFSLFDNSLFSWHPVFMSLGFLLFMTEGIIASIMFRHLDGPDRVRAIQGHGLLQLRAVLCIAAGFVVIYLNKNRMGKPHFRSLHAKCGLATVVLAGLSPVLGVVSFRRMGLIQKFPEPWQPRIKWLHRQMGVICWVGAMLTIQLALPHPAVNKGVLTQAWQAGVAGIGLLMLALVVKAKVKPTEDSLSKAVQPAASGQVRAAIELRSDRVIVCPCAAA